MIIDVWGRLGQGFWAIRCTVSRTGKERGAFPQNGMGKATQIRRTKAAYESIISKNNNPLYRQQHAKAQKKPK